MRGDPVFRFVLRPGKRRPIGIEAHARSCGQTVDRSFERMPVRRGRLGWPSDSPLFPKPEASQESPARLRAGFSVSERSVTVVFYYARRLISIQHLRFFLIGAPIYIFAMWADVVFGSRDPASTAGPGIYGVARCVGLRTVESRLKPLFLPLSYLHKVHCGLSDVHLGSQLGGFVNRF